MQLSKKQNIFSQFSVQFVKSKSNFEHFEKKDDPPSLWISQITDSERRC